MYLKIFGKNGTNIHYKTYPRIVGKLGKDFIIAHQALT
jgi:hypothetical protein